MFVEAVLIGLFIGGFRGGRLSNIIDMNLKGWYLILIALILQVIPLFLGSNEFVFTNQKYIIFAGIISILIVVFMNLDKKGFWIILLGGLFNIGVLLFNGLSMPIVVSNLDSPSIATMVESISDGNIVNYFLSEVTGIGTIFTKFIVITKPYPFTHIMTIGDILMTIGIIIMINGEMSRTNFFGKSSMVRYSYGTTFSKR